MPTGAPMERSVRYDEGYRGFLSWGYSSCHGIPIAVGGVCAIAPVYSHGTIAALRCVCMSTTAIELYNALVDAGIEKKRAEHVAKSVLSKEEAQSFATKSDIAELRSDIAELRSELRVQIARINLLTALNVGIFVAVLANFVVA